MPRDWRPTDMARELAEKQQRKVYAVWHRNQAQTRVVVGKFSRKIKRYGIDKRQRQVIWSNFEDAGLSGDMNPPDPRHEDGDFAGYLREQLKDIDDVVVFYSDLLGDPDDPAGRMTGSELEFIFDPGMRPRLRYWFGGVDSIELELAQIGNFRLRQLPWMRLPPGCPVFSASDPDGRLDAEVNTSLTLLLNDGVEPAASAAAPSLAPLPDPAPAPSPSGGGWLGRLFGRKA